MKFIKNIFVLSLHFILLLGQGCRSDKAIDDFSLIANPDIIGSVDSTIIITSIQSTFEDTSSGTAGSQFLELGESDGIRAYSLIKFGLLSDSATVISAKLILNTNTLFSDGASKSAFTASLHEILSDWEQRTVRFENRPDYEQNPISTTTIVSSAASSSGADSLFTETVTFEMDENGIALVNEWRDEANNNFGFFLSHENSNFIKEFFSDTSSFNQPRLQLEIENTAGRDTVLVVATESAYIFERTIPQSTGPLYIDNLFNNATVLKFDFSQLKKSTFVNDAVLKLNFIEDKSTLKSSGFAIRIDLLKAPYTDKESVNIDSTISPILDVVNRSSNPTTISFDQYLQFWLTEDFDNYGILIRALVPGSDVSKVAFHSNTTNISLAPRIEAIVSSTGVD